jgi:MoxR-like ATPase
VEVSDHCSEKVLFAAAMSDTFEIDGVRLYLSRADDSKGDWIGQRETLKQLLACWLVVNEADLPLSPRLVGPPGIGKTTLGMAAARTRQQ